MPNTSRAEHSDAGAQDDGGRPSDGVRDGGASRGGDVEPEDECVLARAIRQLPCGEIVRRLSPGERAALAATCSTMMAAVLEGCENTRWIARLDCTGQQVHGKLRGKVPRHATALVGWPEPRTGLLYHRRAGGDAQDASCIERIGPKPGMIAGFVSITPDMTGLRSLRICVERKHLATLACGEDWLPKHVAAGIRELKIRNSDVQSVPPGMAELADLDVSYCDYLDPDELLPATSRAKLRVLDAGCSRIRRLPEDMMALEELHLDTCVNLAPDSFLPCSIASRLRTLTLKNNLVERLPAGMVALEELFVDHCTQLDENFLPPSSAAQLRVLRAKHSALRKLPRGLAVLEELNVRGCKLLDDDMDADAAARLKAWDVQGSKLRLPAGMASFGGIPWWCW